MAEEHPKNDTATNVQRIGSALTDLAVLLADDPLDAATKVMETAVLAMVRATSVEITIRALRHYADGLENPERRNNGH